MSRITQIEAALGRLSGEEFQSFCDVLLRHIYDLPVHSPGKVIGKNKTRIGTPDSFIQLSKDTFAFAEMTTTQKDIGTKFKKDLTKCLDKMKTGVAVDNIKTVFLCCNITLEPKIRQNLTKWCATKSPETELVFYDIDSIKHEVYKYGKIAFDFLDISYDTGQVLSLSDFISETERKGTTQRNAFISQSEEFAKMQMSISQKNMLLLTGKAGSGKTRTGLEIIKAFKAENPEYEALCILSKNLPIHEDLQGYFLAGKKYIVLVDDANRLSNLKTVTEWSVSKRATVKLVLSLRDYTLPKTERFFKAENYAYDSFPLSNLSKDDAEQLLRDMGVKNSTCIHNLIDIAQGNARLLVMAAERALDTNDCNSLKKVADIYQKFYASMMSENFMSDKVLRQVLGIICFFRVLRKSNSKQNNKIYQVFGIDEQTFWEKVEELDRLEFIDFYEDRIIRIANQNLAYYFFYYTFIERADLNFSLLLEKYALDLSGKMRDNLNPIFNYLGYEEILEKISSKIKSAYRKINTDKEKIKYLELFGSEIITETLLFVMQKVQELPVSEKPDYKFSTVKVNSYRTESLISPYYNLISNLTDYSFEEYKIAVELIFSCLEKQPSILQEVIAYFSNITTFDQTDVRNGFRRQKFLFKFIFRRIDEKINDDLYVGMLFAISHKYLQIISFGNRRKNRRAINLTEEPVSNPRELNWQLRRELIIKILSLYQPYSISVLNFLENYHIHPNSKSKDIYSSDFNEYLFPFFNVNFDPENLRHCEIVIQMLKEARLANVVIPNRVVLKIKFRNQSALINKFVKLYFRLRRGRRTDYYNEVVNRFFKYYSSHDYRKLVDTLKEIVIYKKMQRRDLLETRLFLESVLLDLLNKDTDAFLNVLTYILKTGNKIEFFPFTSYHRIHEKFDFEVLQTLLDRHDFLLKDVWFFHFLVSVPESKINAFFAKRLKTFLKNSESSFSVVIHELGSYRKVIPGIIESLITITMERKDTHNSTHQLRGDEIFGQCFGELSTNMPLMQKFYIYCCENDESDFDEEGVFLEKILLVNPDFIFELVGYFNQNQYSFADSLKGKDYSFIWNRKDSFKTMSRLIDMSIVAESYVYGEHILCVFFSSTVNTTKLGTFCHNYFQVNINEVAELYELFRIINLSYPGKIMNYVEMLIKLNPPAKVISNLHYYPKQGSAWGSQAPWHRSDIKVRRKMISLLKGNIQYLQIIADLEYQIEEYKKGIKKEEEWSFTNDY